jgi:acetylornithine deacetylase/succinyl-diaminopimelate desuccinylase-like protein
MPQLAHLCAVLKERPAAYDQMPLMLCGSLGGATLIIEQETLMKRTLTVAVVLYLLACPPARPDTSPGEPRFREIYKELVETNTSLSAGSCTLAAERMATRLKAAGFPDRDLHLFTAPGHPKEGGLVAVYSGREPQNKAILLLAHLDVVEAKRDDWTRDPFTLVEENGNFYARGVIDDKAMGAIWVDTMVRFLEGKYRPLRTLKLALTCGEETTGALNGAYRYLQLHHQASTGDTG